MTWPGSGDNDPWWNLNGSGRLESKDHYKVQNGAHLIHITSAADGKSPNTRDRQANKVLVIRTRIYSRRAGNVGKQRDIARRRREKCVTLQARDHPLTLTLKFGPRVTLEARLTRIVPLCVGRGWLEIVKIGEELEGIYIDFAMSFNGVVGNGKDIGFCLDRWICDVRLCDRFPRLYYLDRRKDSRVADQGKWVNNEWCWVRDLKGMVGRDFEDLVVLFQNFVISNNCGDHWKWLLQEDGDFTFKGFSRMIEEKTLRIENGGQKTLWNKCVPKKVNIFVWRSLKGRLPVREELDKRGMDLDSILCPCYDSAVESCNHSLVMCNFARSVWEKIFIWWKFGGVNALYWGNIFIQWERCYF
uniref:Reverse transcriptase domain, reverse transcriptase zinc-binding domain protein n=1 Tax=Tanacetum cinerariifolium TaxID=118510 RepID=A0A699J0G5_TANCI|nr:reverse transcriptase domain, reverse transcriptase zinc-binding domain protein [Tanacetum cinerariifolium]